MASELRVNTLKDASGNNSVATSIIAEGTIKTWVNYDAADQATRGSFGQSSLTDSATGTFVTNHSSNFNSATDKCVITGIWDTSDDGGSDLSGSVRGHCDINQNGSIAASSSSLAFVSAYGARSSSDGAAADTDANYISILGDLA
mgnify:CR=1 FL=1|tara:strand:- start:21591 stop:22025 length:435 start_codon:yes stop_codon:yes gene_type:complete